MSKTQTKSQQTTITLSPAELEALIRRVVREEIGRLVPPTHPSVLDNGTQEGSEDPDGDQELLQEALAIVEEYGDKPEAWTDWETFKGELKQAEAAGELPD